MRESKGQTSLMEIVVVVVVVLLLLALILFRSSTTYSNCFSEAYMPKFSLGILKVWDAINCTIF
jgi:hypothetical protein